VTDLLGAAEHDGVDLVGQAGVGDVDRLWLFCKLQEEPRGLPRKRLALSRRKMFLSFIPRIGHFRRKVIILLGNSRKVELQEEPSGLPRKSLALSRRTKVSLFFDGRIFDCSALEGDLENREIRVCFFQVWSTSGCPHACTFRIHVQMYRTEKLFE
jgi:hypothetical protein